MTTRKKYIGFFSFYIFLDLGHNILYLCIPTVEIYHILKKIKKCTQNKNINFLVNGRSKVLIAREYYYLFEMRYLRKFQNHNLPQLSLYLYR